MSTSRPGVNPFPTTQVAADALPAEAVRRLRAPGWRFGHLTARVLDSGQLAVEALLLDTGAGGGEILWAPVPPGESEFASLTPVIPAAHWAERGVGDMFGLRAAGHPRWKSLLLHNDAWPDPPLPLRPEAAGPTPAPRENYAFMRVKGEGIHEIPVGPIHAGIIEPGHFRFSCMGEIITNLEIRLGYLHRGIERRACEVPWRFARFVAEAAAGDTTVGYALAHAVAMEQMLGVAPPARAQALRTIALEIERLASHIGDLGALCGDIGYSAGASLFPPLRASVLALGTTLAGSRFQRAYVVPGGVRRDLDDARRREMAGELEGIARTLRARVPLVLQNPGVLDRMEGTGRLAPGLARDFGVVGPAGRASGSRYDARTAFPHAAYPEIAPAPAHEDAGDVLARTKVRAQEAEASVRILAGLLDNLPDTGISTPLPDALPPSSVGVGVVEAWRGELIVWATTDANGALSRYAVRDPSLSNWTALAIAIRGNLVADFPLTNKSFNLSYSGNDL